jgi:hypothetical protein
MGIQLAGQEDDPDGRGPCTYRYADATGPICLFTSRHCHFSIQQSAAILGMCLTMDCL